MPKVRTRTYSNLFLIAFTVIYFFLLNSIDINGQELLPPYLLGYWRFDEGQGNIVHDETIYGNDGIIEGPQQWVISSQSGYALSFPGNLPTHAKVSFGDKPSLINLSTNQLRIEAWVYPYSNEVVNMTIFSRNGPYLLAIQDQKVRGSVFFGGGPEGWTEVIGTTKLVANHWYHLAVTYDSKNITVYVNGISEGSVQENRPIYMDNHNVYLAWGEPGEDKYFEGAIDEVKIYNKAFPPIYGIMDITVNSPLYGFTYDTSTIDINLTVVSDALDSIWFSTYCNGSKWKCNQNYGNNITYTYPVKVPLKQLELGENSIFNACYPSYTNGFTVYANNTAGKVTSVNVCFNHFIPEIIVTENNHNNYENWSTSFYAGEPVSFDVVIKNIGNAPAGSFNWIYDLDYNENSTKKSTSLSDGFEPGDIIRLNLTYIYPTYGNYTFYFETDPSDSLDEYDNDNNVELFTFFINGTPDLTPKFITYQQDSQNKKKVAFEFDIQNIGTIYTKKFAYNIDYGDGTGSGGYIFENIEPSEAYKLKLNHTYPSLGAYNLTLQIDPNNDISELNETNNILVKKIGLRRL